MFRKTRITIGQIQTEHPLGFFCREAATLLEKTEGLLFVILINQNRHNPVACSLVKVPVVFTQRPGTLLGWPRCQSAVHKVTLKMIAPRAVVGFKIEPHLIAEFEYFT